ncbi:thioesterase domain-containing protein [Streptomyces sp. M19]
MALLKTAAEILPGFSSAAELERLAEPVRVSRGDRTPKLICLPSPMAFGGAQQYARFAAHFRGRRRSSSPPSPGSARASRCRCRSTRPWRCSWRVRTAAAGAPFVLLGYSSGGQFAHVVAEALEKAGTPAAAVVVLDTYLPRDDGKEEILRQLLQGMLDRESSFGRLSTVRLAAMSRYSELIVDCLPGALSAPCCSSVPRSRSPRGEDRGLARHVGRRARVGRGARQPLHAAGGDGDANRRGGRGMAHRLVARARLRGFMTHRPGRESSQRRGEMSDPCVDIAPDLVRVGPHCVARTSAARAGCQSCCWSINHMVVPVGPHRCNVPVRGENSSR